MRKRDASVSEHASELEALYSPRSGQALEGDARSRVCVFCCGLCANAGTLCPPAAPAVSIPPSASSISAFIALNLGSQRTAATARGAEGFRSV